MGQKREQRDWVWERGRGGRLVILGVMAFGVVEILNGAGLIRHPLGRLSVALGCGWSIERVFTDRKNQRETKQYLHRLLAQAGESYQALQQESKEFEQYASAENQRLEATNHNLVEEMRCLVEVRDDLQVEVWELQEQVEQLTAWREDEIGGVDDRGIGREGEEVDLAGVEVAIVGGHHSMRRSVLEELKTVYGLGKGLEIPTLWEAKSTQRQLRAQLDQCDLIGIVTGYMSHPLTQMIMDLKRADTLQGHVMLITSRGKTGVVRDILKYFNE